MLLRVLPLFLLIAIGVFVGAVGLFPDRERAIATLNRFALYLAFPALIIAGIANPALSPPDGPGFYILHAVSFVVVCAVAWIVGGLSAFANNRGTIVLCTVFGNIAYFGIPFVERFLGDAASGLAALSAAIHVALAMLFGPFLYLVGNRFDRSELRSNPLVSVLKQPLVWSPVIGLASRFMDGPVADLWLDLTRTIGGSAGPIALIMLGLYVWHKREALRSIGGATFAILALKLLVYPAIVLGIVFANDSFGFMSLTDLEAKVAAMMAGMPVAVTTFSISEEYGRGRDIAAGGILVSTLLSIITLQVVAAI